MCVCVYKILSVVMDEPCGWQRNKVCEGGGEGGLSLGLTATFSIVQVKLLTLRNRASGGL